MGLKVDALNMCTQIHKQLVFKCSSSLLAFLSTVNKGHNRLWKQKEAPGREGEQCMHR